MERRPRRQLPDDFRSSQPGEDVARDPVGQDTLDHRLFPRIWIPDAGMRDHRQLLMHRHKLVQMGTRVKNELQHLMLNQGMQKKQKLWSTEGRAALASLPLEPWTDRRRKDLLNLLAMLDAQL